MEILFWILVGLIAGWLAKAVVPGPEPSGFFWTLIIGIVGAFIGGLLYWALGYPPARGFNLGSIFMAFIGAVILLALWKAFTARRTAA
ncbi:MAG: GlsB/YeaQ/YmgE family stress response membrane protein [Armatimonadetes bacterium]|nr:GlsB/YeaQ/YmgE family stress response membrane protein [Armatimonadota bacterium]